MKKRKHSVNTPFIKSLNRSELRMRHHFPKMSRRCLQTQFLSTVGFANEMKLKSRLPSFSLICIWCQRVFCLWLHSHLHLSKFWYTRTVRLGTLGCFRFHVWEGVLCWLTGNYHWSVQQDTQFLAGQTDTETNYSSRYGFVRIWFK